MAGEERRRDRLDQPRDVRRPLPRVPYNPEAFGEISERVARFFGTARYLAIQSVIVVLWIVVNVFAATLRWDPYPFILLNLVFSTQAAYAAPLILLAQNRQANRDRVQAEQDRARDERTIADTEYLAREIASIRIALGEVTTRDFLRFELQRLLEEVRGEEAKPPDQATSPPRI